MSRFLIKNKAQKGFTLIELMITVALLGILLALAMPYFGNLIQARRLQAATEAMVKMLSATKSQTEKESRDLYVAVLNSGTSTWRLTTSTCPITDVSFPCSTTFPPDIQATDHVSVTLSGPNWIQVKYRSGGMSYNSSNEKIFTITASSGISMKILTTETGLISACSSTDLINSYPSCPAT